MNQTLFIADLHLSDNRPDITHCLLNFLSTIDAERTDALYVLGDLFEVWIGDDEVTPFTKCIANAFNAVRNSGVPIFFTHGNRDFLLGKQYADSAGMTLLPEQQVIDLYGEPTLVLHGDELCTKDVAYQKFRKKARSWWWPRLILCLPLFARRKIAAKGRKVSKANQAKLTNDIMDVTPEEVLVYLDRFKVKRMIHGHTHRPAIHTIQNAENSQAHNPPANNPPAKRIVLGDWYEQGSILVVTPETIRLQNLRFTDQPA